MSAVTIDTQLSRTANVSADRASSPRPSFRTARWALWTGYLGGAVAIHVQVGNPLYTHVLFPIYIAVLLWSSLVVRNVRVARALGFRG